VSKNKNNNSQGSRIKITFLTIVVAKLIVNANFENLVDYWSY